MSNFVVPNTFTAGTKAKAEEVNENFTAIKDDLDTKSGQIQTLQTNVSTLQTDVGTKVLKSGDTMTGDLNIHKSSEPFIKFQSDDFDYTTTTAPSAMLNIGGIQIKDVNGNITGEFRNSFDTANTLISKINATRNINGEEKVATLEVLVDENGNSLCNFPKCTTKATTTSSASTSRVAVVVTNYKNGASWYRVWSDGWIEQGGAGNTLSTAISLLKSYADTNYDMQISAVTTGSTGSSYGYAVYSKTKSNFKVSIYAGNTAYNWYACGY